MRKLRNPECSGNGRHPPPIKNCIDFFIEGSITFFSRIVSRFKASCALDLKNSFQASKIGRMRKLFMRRK